MLVITAPALQQNDWDWTEALRICNIHAGGRLPTVIPLPFRLSSSTSWVVLRNGLFSARAFREVVLGNAMDSQLSDDGQLGCAVKALVHSGGIPARELVRSTR